MSKKHFPLQWTFLGVPNLVCKQKYLKNLSLAEPALPTIPGGWVGGWVGVEIIRIKAISVQSIKIDIGLTGTELGKT